MGLFGKKKTSYKTTVDKLTLTRIVKLSYIQSILINGGTAKSEEFAGLTQASTSTRTISQDSTRNDATKGASLAGIFNANVGKDLKLGKTAGKILDIGYNAALGGIPAIVKGLFGKKTKTETWQTTKESGWSIVKTWAQPQFDIIRYAIGIKDIGVTQFLYSPVSEMISKAWTSPKEVVKVRLLVDQFIPPEYPEGTYLEYYIKPDDDTDKWIRINPIELPTTYSEADATKPIPRIISFNGERPISSSSEESYLLTTKPVTSIRLKVIIKRPESSDPSSTPILRSYRILMTPRGGIR